MGMRPDGSQATRRRTVRAAFITCRRVFGIAFRTKLGAFILTFCDRLHLINVFSRVDALAETRLLLFLLPSALLFSFMEPLRGGLGGSAGTNEAAAKSAKSASVVGSRGGVGVRQTDIIPKQY
jgi:hypothetical protein